MKKNAASEAKLGDEIFINPPLGITLTDLYEDKLMDALRVRASRQRAVTW